MLRSRTLCVLAGWLLAATLPLVAQNAQITGQVTDSTASAVPGVRVTITSLDTGLQRAELTTSAEGYYTAALLPRGRYEVTVSAPGFKTSKSPILELEEGQAMRVDLPLEVGQVSESIEVTARAGLLATETTFRFERHSQPAAWWTCRWPDAIRWRLPTWCRACGRWAPSAV